jgi:hypothetical protein
LRYFTDKMLDFFAKRNNLTLPSQQYQWRLAKQRMTFVYHLCIIEEDN